MDPMNMPPAGIPPGMMQDSGINLLSIVINVIFGFIVGLMIFIGPKEIIAYGSKLAGDIIKLTGYGQQMAAFGFATTAAPYIILVPVAGMFLRQLSSVRSLKGFGFFAGAVLAGLIVAFLGQGYFAGLIK